MGYSERPCMICEGRFNMARLRRRGESLANAWDVHRDFWRPGVDPNGDEHEENPAIITPKYVDGTIVGYWSDSNNAEFCALYVKGEGIEAGSACCSAGCDESDGDHACGGPGCDFGGEGYYMKSAYNGWRISVKEMKIMTCVQTVIKPENRAEWQPEEDDEEDERTSRHGLVLTAVSESAPDEFEVSHVPYRHGVGGTISIGEDDYGFEECGIPFHGPCYQILKKVAKKSFPDLNILDGLYDLWNVSVASKDGPYGLTM